MITEDYVSFETAKLLKEKGFVVPYDSFRGVYINGKFLRRNPGQSYLCNMGDEIMDVCSIQMAMKWLREEKKIGIEVNTNFDLDDGNKWYYEYGFCVFQLSDTFKKFAECDYDGYKTYEEACDSAIKYCLENLI